MILVDQPGDQSWPITGASFILIYRDQKDEATAKTMLKFFDWCFRHGQDVALNLDYVPVPDNVVELVERMWKNRVRFQLKPVWE